MMKKPSILFFYLAAVIFFSCNQADKSADSHHHEHKENREHMHTDSASGTTEDSGLRLNDGKKWESDEATRIQFDKMQALVTSFSASTPNPVLADYNMLGNAMQAELDVLFKKCTMQDESHNQLHTLLETIIADVKSLKGSDEKSASEAYRSLPEHLSLFQKYFN